MGAAHYERARVCDSRAACFRHEADILPGCGRGKRTVDPEVTAAFEACWASEDFAEGQATSREKRPPTFRGR